MTTKNHPIQPLGLDDYGVMRFKKNAIVRFLLDSGPFDMNALAIKDFSQEDREQFAQLIGYSLIGFSELPYVRDETLNAAEIMANGRDDEHRARVEALEAMIHELRLALRDGIATLYGKHPDDLIEADKEKG